MDLAVLLGKGVRVEDIPGRQVRLQVLQAKQGIINTPSFSPWIATYLSALFLEAVDHVFSRRVPQLPRPLQSLQTHHIPVYVVQHRLKCCWRDVGNGNDARGLGKWTIEHGAEDGRSQRKYKPVTLLR